jgi:hypothetical protein
MNRIQMVGAGVVVLLVVIGIGANVMAHKLDQEVRQQCANHNWPAEAHDIHVDWCSANGYAVE